MTGLTLFHPDGGEVIEAVDAATLLYAAGVADVRQAGTDELAEVTEKLGDLKALANEADGVVSDELVRRLDMGGKWTLHEGDYTIKSSSPTAGTVSYDVDELGGVLANLVADEVISEAGANGALECIEATASVPYALLRTISLALDGQADQFDHEMAAQWVENLLNAEPEPSYKVKLAGVNALLKVPAAREAVEACQVVSEPGRRRAKVTRS